MAEQDLMSDEGSDDDDNSVFSSFLKFPDETQVKREVCMRCR